MARPQTIGLFALGLAAASALMPVASASAHDGYRHHYRWERARAVDVHAPFTRVDTRRGRYTAVDAPFASVRVLRGRGVWVRAPFVNLYVPR